MTEARSLFFILGFASLEEVTFRFEEAQKQVGMFASSRSVCIEAHRSYPTRPESSLFSVEYCFFIVAFMMGC